MPEPIKEENQTPESNAKKAAPVLTSEASFDSIASVMKNEAIAKQIQDADALRANGATKVLELKEEITSLRKNREIDDATKTRLIAEDRVALKKATITTRKNSVTLKKTVAKTSLLIQKAGSANEKRAKEVYESVTDSLKRQYETKLSELAAEHERNMSSLSTQPPSDSQRQAVKDEEFAFKSAKTDARRIYTEGIQTAKSNKNDVFLDKYNALNYLRGNKNGFKENVEYKAKEYAYKFSWGQFFMRNALYIVILMIYLFCIIYAPINNYGNLFTWKNILTIFAQSSTRMFFALGVAGLILLAGTDLSFGRLAGMGMTFTAVILHGGTNVIVFFNLGAWNFDSWNPALRVILALSVSIFACTLISALAGFFTAKFKMHPFITTLATQLIVYGLMMYSTNGVNSGSLDANIKYDVAGNWGDFSKLTLYAIIAIVIVWFIWNKTKFGKNIYAVGGNAEAASVSGISVFWVTLGVFIMAGILYGIGAFLEATRIGLGSAQSGYGYELDAIAACVVGGISFSGGIGKVKGAVIGVVIFTGLTYCLSFINFDTNFQFLLKGIIIMTAVALDSVKYLKKK